MKIHDFKLIKFGEKTLTGKIYSKDSLKFIDKDYLGYVNYDASTIGIIDAIAFSIEKLRIVGEYLVCDVNIINGKSTELLTWIDQFDIGITSFGDWDDESGIISNAEIISFVAYPI